MVLLRLQSIQMIGPTVLVLIAMLTAVRRPPKGSRSPAGLMLCRYLARAATCSTPGGRGYRPVSCRYTGLQMSLGKRLFGERNQRALVAHDHHRLTMPSQHVDRGLGKSHTLQLK